MYIEDCAEPYVGSFDDVLKVMRRGDANRSVAETRMNQKSSRSHAVLIMTVSQRNVNTNAKKVSKLVSRVLAGEEQSLNE